MVELCLEPFEVRSDSGSWGGPRPALDLLLLRLVAEQEPVVSKELSAQLWPGMPERWALVRLAETRRCLGRRLGEQPLRTGSAGWHFVGQRCAGSSNCVQVCLDPPQLCLGQQAWALSASGARLVAALADCPEGLSIEALVSQLHCTPAALRQLVTRTRRSVPDGILLGGSGGYRLRADRALLY